MYCRSGSKLLTTLSKEFFITETLVEAFRKLMILPSAAYRPLPTPCRLPERSSPHRYPFWKVGVVVVVS